MLLLLGGAAATLSLLPQGSQTSLWSLSQCSGLQMERHRFLSKSPRLRLLLKGRHFDSKVYRHSGFCFMSTSAKWLPACGSFEK